MAKKLGRPTKFTQELADAVCEQIAQGKSMRTVCAPDEMPAIATLFRWLREHESFREQYARATEERSEAFAEETIDIADDSLSLAQESDDPKRANALVQAQRVRIDTRKWLMAKMKPKKYGDKLDLTSDGKALPTPIYGGISKKQNED